MQLSLKRTLIAAALASGLVGLSAVAVAQNAPPADKIAQHQAQRTDTQGKHRADRMAQRQERMAQRRAEHQAQLKAALQLAPEQEAAWSAFVARTAPEPRAAGQASPQQQDRALLTTPERLDQMQARHAERGERMTQRIDATRSFYAELTPEQQKAFDSHSQRGFQRAGMKGPGRGHHGHGHHRGMGMGMGEGGHSDCSGPMMHKRS